MAALTTVQAYQRELEKLIAFEIERLIEQVANGYIENYEEYRSLVGKISGLRTAADLMQEADKICAEKYH